jgi:stress-induced morphogen
LLIICSEMSSNSNSSSSSGSHGISSHTHGGHSTGKETRLHFDDLHLTPKKFMPRDVTAAPRRLMSPMNLLTTGSYATTTTTAHTYHEKSYGESKSELDNSSHYVNSVIQDRIFQDMQTIQQNKEIEAALRKELQLSKEYVALNGIKSHRETDDTHKITLERLKAEYESALREKTVEYEMKIQDLNTRLSFELASERSRLEASNELQMKEKETVLEIMTVKIKEREKKLLELEKALKDREISYNERIREINVRHGHDLVQQESLWKDRLEEASREAETRMLSIENKHSIEATTKEITLSAQCDAVEERFKTEYTKKLKKCEKQVKEAARAFALRLQYTEGVLNEARRETQAQHASFAAQIQALREEIELKDRRILRQQVYIDSANSVRDACVKWKDETAALCNAVLQACSTIAEIPNLDEREIVSELLKGMSSLEATTVNVKIKQQEYRKEYVAVNRKQITKVYQACQKMLQKAENYSVPGIE